MSHAPQDLIDLHVNQSYDDDHRYQIDLEGLSKKYSFLPNECAYLIDCKSAELILLDDKFTEVTGAPEASGKLVPLYEHVKTSQLDDFMSQTKSIVAHSAFGKHKHLIQNESDWVNMVYKTVTGKTLLKCTTSIFKCPNGLFRYTIGKITDISNLGHTGHFAYKFSGPHAVELQAVFDDISETTPFLSKREIQVLGMIGKGARSQEIGTLLNISKLTVDTHRKNIIHKLETSGSINAYNKAKDIGLI